MLELWGMRSIPLLPSLPSPLWPGVVGPDRFLSMGQIERNCVLQGMWSTPLLLSKLRPGVLASERVLS